MRWWILSHKRLGQQQQVKGTLTLHQPWFFTSTGWEDFSTVLRNLASGGDSINDGTMISQANLLANSSKMKEMILINPDIITAWATFSHIVLTITLRLIRPLCNTSRIIDTYRSNHTIQKICESYREDRLLEDTISFLRTNWENSESQAVRLKICNRLSMWNRKFCLTYAIAWWADSMAEAIKSVSISMDYLGALHRCLMLIAWTRRGKWKTNCFVGCL